MATQSEVQLAPDGTGKKIDTVITAIGLQHRQVVVLGDSSTDANVGQVTAAGAQKVDGSAVNQPVLQPSLTVVSATAVAGTAVTATLAAVSGQFHYINFIEIVKYGTTSAAGTATPILVTTTNLPGSLTFTFDSTQTIGATISKIYSLSAPLKASASNTATTFVCPATTNVIWRVNVYYYTGP